MVRSTVRTLAGMLGRALVEPLRRNAIPRRLAAVDAAVLAVALGRPVHAVARLAHDTGTTARARLRLTTDAGEETVFVKGPADRAGPRLFAALAGLGENELRFYRDVRPGLALAAPAVHGVLHDPGSGRYLLVLEDLVASGARFLDLRTALAPDVAAACLSALAMLHGAFWESPRLDDARGDLRAVARNGADPLLGLFGRLMRAAIGRIERTRDPALLPAAGRAVLLRYPAVARAIDRGPTTLLHGDPHPGNAYLRDGRAGWFDWQVMRRGPALRDVVYCLVLSLDVATRRAEERALLAHYCGALAAAGGPRLAVPDVLPAYRANAAYVYAAAAFTAGMRGLQPDDVAGAGLARAAAAVDDLDPWGALAAGSARPV